MYVHFTFMNGSNPYITTSDRGLFRMIRVYTLEQTAEEMFSITGCAAFWTVKNRRLTDYEKAKTALRDFAIQWQADASRFNYSWGELCDWAMFFEKYGKKYGLLREFRENCIC